MVNGGSCRHKAICFSAIVVMLFAADAFALFPSGDMNRDGATTPADALCVFRRFLGLSSCLDEGTRTGSFVDDFLGQALNVRFWNVFHGTPQVMNGILVLAGDMATRAEIQSTMSFRPGVVLQIALTSSDLKPQPPEVRTDTSFGFEFFTGANGQCHYGVLMTGKGVLGLLHPAPDANGNCSGDPLFQEYQALPNWESLRAGQTIIMTLIWTLAGATLHVSGVNAGAVTRSTDLMAVPDVPLRLRLNVDFGEMYHIDYVFAIELPQP